MLLLYFLIKKTSEKEIPKKEKATKKTSEKKQLIKRNKTIPIQNK